MDSSFLVTTAVFLIYVTELATVALAISRKRDTQSAIAWTLAILFIPILGVIAFLLFGFDRIPGRLRRKTAHVRNVRQLLRKGLTESQAIKTLAARDGWQGLGRLAESAGAEPISDGNEVTLLGHGQPAFDAIIEAIKAAQNHVHVEEYIFRDDRLGTELLNAMIDRAKAGLKVRLMVDAIGSPINFGILRRLKKAGGEGAVFMPLLPFSKVFQPNLRNHRKIIVVDGKVGFLGGLNVGEEYAGRRFRRRYWCDAHLRIAGPAVADLQRVFLEDWDFTLGKMPDSKDCFPVLPPTGKSRVQVITGGPDAEFHALRLVVFSALTNADKNIRIATPYLVPDLAMREALVSAAMRGVDVTILTQGRPPDSWLTYWASRYYWEELLNAGVKIYEYTRGMMHSKMLLVDNAWANVGSANLDPRSLRLNFEIAGCFDSPHDIAAFYERFEQDLAGARQVTLHAFQNRKLLHRVLEQGARLAAPLL